MGRAIALRDDYDGPQSPSEAQSRWSQKLVCERGPGICCQGSRYRRAVSRSAIVLSVDEKPSIQALECAQGYLKLSGGKTLSGYSHNYKRHGTTTAQGISGLYERCCRRICGSGNPRYS